jgi:hypothetical protein
MKMIEHVWTVVCGRATTDKETNNISLLEVIEQLNLLGPAPDPSVRIAVPIPFECVSLWSRSNLAEPEESLGRLKIIAPNGTELLVQEFPVNLSQDIRMRTQMRSIGLPLAGTGRYMFTVEIRRVSGEWNVVARIPVQVEAISQVPAAAAPV